MFKDSDEVTNGEQSAGQHPDEHTSPEAEDATQTHTHTRLPQGLKPNPESKQQHEARRR